MSELILPDSRFQMPGLFSGVDKPVDPVRVNPAHWIHKKLNCLWFDDNEDNQLRDIVSGQNMAPVNSPTHLYTDTIYNRGVAATGNVSTKAHYRKTTNDCWGLGKTSISFFAYIKVIDADAFGYDGRILTSDDGTSTANHHWMIGYTASGEIRTRIRTTNNAASTVITSGLGLADNDILLLVGSFDGSNREIRGFFNDGTKVSASDSATGSLYEVTTDSVALLATAHAPSDDNYAESSVFYSGTYSDYLTDEQCWSLVYKPYQFLIPI